MDPFCARALTLRAIGNQHGVAIRCSSLLVGSRSAAASSTTSTVAVAGGSLIGGASTPGCQARVGACQATWK